jgi:6-phosphogluconolactonase (cycloisomerase 2 family)
MRDRRSRLTWLVGFVVLLTAVPRAGEARITLVQEEGIEDGHFEYQFIGDVMLSPDARHLYAASGYPANRILIYARSPETGAIVELDAVDPLAAGGVGILVFSPDGAYLYALDYYSGQVVVFARDATTGLLTRLQAAQPGTSGINQQWQGMTISPDGAHVYATAAGLNAIGVYARDASTGLLTLVDVESGMPGLSRPVGVHLSPDGAHVYVACYRPTGAIVVLARDAVTGQLSGVQDIENGDGGQNLSYQFAVDVAPDGGQVYVSGSQGIVVLQRDATTGVLTRVQSTVDGSDHDVWITADGTRAYSCGSSQGLRGYARDPLTGVLGSADEAYLPGDDGFAPPAFCFGMTMTTDGRQLYTIVTYDVDLPSSPYFYTIAAFRRLNATCSAAPLPACHTPAVARGSSINIRGATRARLSWKWKGPGPAADLGHPLDGASDAALCVYDARGQLVRIVAPGSAPCPGDRSCWQQRAAADFRYTDSKAARDGIKLVKLSERRPMDVRLGVEARGQNLDLPTLPMIGPVSVQLQISDGATSSCWGASYSASSRNFTLQYRATSDP